MVHPKQELHPSKEGSTRLYINSSEESGQGKTQERLIQEQILPRTLASVRKIIFFISPLLPLSSFSFFFPLSRLLKSLLPFFFFFSLSLTLSRAVEHLSHHSLVPCHAPFYYREEASSFLYHRAQGPYQMTLGFHFHVSDGGVLLRFFANMALILELDRSKVHRLELDRASPINFRPAQ